MPGTIALVDRLRAAGHAAVVSGAGPSVLVLARRAPDGPDPVRQVTDLTPEGWRVYPLEVDLGGARVTRVAPGVSSS